MIWKLRTRTLAFDRRPLVMGILNATPDSFSDGGRFAVANVAVDRALRMEDEGADIIDLGGESTRPYAESVVVDDELARVVPILEQLQNRLSVPISIDTSKARVAQAAVDLGADIINDVTGLEGDPEMLRTAVESQAGVCVMHMQGTPQTMQDEPTYDNVVEDIMHYLQQRKDYCLNGGIDSQRICLDPGIGFGKTHEHNLRLLKNAARFLELGTPILIGHSRKGFIKKMVGESEERRDAGTLGVSLAMAAMGIHIVRVHNVQATVAALKLYDACCRLDNE